MNVLITGGTGFIGIHVARLLAERGDQVTSLDVRDPGPAASWFLDPVRDRIRFLTGSIEDMADVVFAVKESKADNIVHIAAVVNDLPKQPWVALRINVGGTLNVLEAARLFDVRRLINFSSIGVLTTRCYEPIDDKHPLMTATDGPGVGFYAAAKVASEAFCWSYRQSFGMDFISIRPSAVYGFGQQVPNFIKPMVEAAVEGKPVRFVSGAGVPRDYTHAADIAQLTARALDIAPERVRDRMFYGATGLPLTTAGSVAKIVKRLVPEADIEIGSDMAPEDINEMRIRGVLSIDNAREQLGYQPRYEDLEKGTTEYIDTYGRYLRHLGSRKK